MINIPYNKIRSRMKDGAYNILTAPTHESYQSNWASMPHTFYLAQHESFKPWTEEQRKLPNNHILMDGNTFPPDMQIDLVLSQNKFGQYQILKPIADQLGVPLINVEHTLPVPEWNNKRRESLIRMSGDVNVFISEFSINEWGFDRSDPTVRVIKHGIDTNAFTPEFDETKLERKVLTVANDYINRDWCLNWSLYKRLCLDNNLPINPVGNTPGFSVPTNNLQELKDHFNKSAVFLNTSIISPVPCSLMEAAAMGVPIVTTDNCMIPEIIEDGYNGFISNDEEYLLDKLRWCLENPIEARETVGQNARKTIQERFSLESHLNEWNKVFNEVMK